LIIQIKQMSIVPKRASPAFAASLKACTFFYQPEQLHCTQIGVFMGRPHIYLHKI
jgi:hypothetical protein